MRRTWFLFFAVLLSACSGASIAVSSTPTPTVQEWQTQITRIPLPSKGCFQAHYPALTWSAVACVPTPPYPQPPNNGPLPDVVGNGDDIAIRAPTGTISIAKGSFDAVTGVTDERSKIGNAGVPIPNAYTLQMNTNFSPPSAIGCKGFPTPFPNPGCSGWEQFVFENTGSAARVFIQYWLIGFDTSCPAGWNQFSFSGSSDINCFTNDSTGAVPLPSAQPITNLQGLNLFGLASASSDSAIVFANGIMAASVQGDNAVDASKWWTDAEYNIFGDGGNQDGGSMAVFNMGASITPRVQINDGSDVAPLCVAEGFTGETNSLSFGPSIPMGA